MERCIVCGGNGLLLHNLCPLCEGIIGWPEQDNSSSLAFDPTLIVPRGPLVSDDFSILTWSICNPGKIDGDSHFDHLSSEDKLWENRFEKIKCEVQHANASIICMQQIHPQLYNGVKEAFETLGYEAFTHKKMQRNSLAIFYWKQAWKKVWEKHVPVKGFEKTLAIGLECGELVLGVVTCQLEGEPKEAKERVERLEKTFSEIQKKPHDALVVAGDFNAPLVEGSWRNSAVSSYLRIGRVPPGTTEWGLEILPPRIALGHGYALKPVYSPSGTFTRSKRKCGGLFCTCGTLMVDQIWFSHCLQLTGVRNPFFDQEFRDKACTQGLPNDQNPSDHLPLGASFQWR